MSQINLRDELPPRFRDYIANGLDLADRHARTRGMDSATPGAGRAFITALSLASLQGPQAAQLLRKVAADGGDVIKAFDAEGMPSIGLTLTAMARARKIKPRQQDAVGITETLAQVGKVYDPLVNTPMWEHWAPIVEVPEFGRNQYVSLRMTVTGQARPNGDVLRNGDTLNLTPDRRSTRIAYFTLETSEDPLSMAQASFQGYSHGRISDLSARLAIKQNLAHYLLYSESAYNWDGALAVNTPVEGDGTALASATVSETVDGVIAVISAFEAAAPEGLRPNRVAISQKVWTKLSGKYTDNGSGRKYLEETYPNIQWQDAIYLNDRTDFDSGTKHAMIVSHVGELGLRTVTAQEPIVMAYPDGIETKALYVQPFAGLHFVHKSNVQAGDFAV